jgi:hypothetical protein
MSEKTKFHFKGKIKKSDFEGLLFETFGHDRDISARPHKEDGKTMTIYYVDDGHAGTWMHGSGFIFNKDEVAKHIESAKKIDEILKGEQHA